MSTSVHEAMGRLGSAKTGANAAFPHEFTHQLPQKIRGRRNLANYLSSSAGTTMLIVSQRWPVPV